MELAQAVSRLLDRIHLDEFDLDEGAPSWTAVGGFRSRTGTMALGTCGLKGVFFLGDGRKKETPAFQGRNGIGAMPNTAQAGPLGAGPTRHPISWSRALPGAEPERPLSHSLLRYRVKVDESVAEPAAC